MRIALVITAALTTALLLGSTAGGGESSGKPALKLAKSYPLTVQGMNFRPGENVRLTVSSQLKRTKSVIASRTGTFLVRFQDAYHRCAGMMAIAVGQQGSRATLKLPIRFRCPMP
jgi:hypothetical protein